jgi:hypothetical protein
VLSQNSVGDRALEIRNVGYVYVFGRIDVYERSEICPATTENDLLCAGDRTAGKSVVVALL